MARPNPFSGLPKFRRGAFALFLVTVLASALLADQALGRALLLHPGAIWSGQGLWQPITANFIFPDGGVGLVLGTLFIQWFLGSELEGFWGTRKYVALVVGCGVAGHLVSVLLAPLLPTVASLPVGGSTAMDLAAVTAFGVVFGKRGLRLFGALPLTARGLAWLIGGVTIVSPLARGAPWPVLVPWLVAILGALLVTTQPWRRLRDSGKLRGSRATKKRNHLRVVRPDRDLLN